LLWKSWFSSILPATWDILGPGSFFWSFDFNDLQCLLIILEGGMVSRFPHRMMVVHIQRPRCPAPGAIFSDLMFVSNAPQQAAQTPSPSPIGP
jgi:hypothetical protein